MHAKKKKCYVITFDFTFVVIYLGCSKEFLGILLPLDPWQISHLGDTFALLTTTKIPYRHVISTYSLYLLLVLYCNYSNKKESSNESTSTNCFKKLLCFCHLK